jgi:hypothetical protein
LAEFYITFNLTINFYNSGISTVTSDSYISVLKYWLLTQVSDSKNVIIFIYLFFLILFLTNKEFKISVKNLIKFFKNLSFHNKYFLFCFTLSYGIPNKIYINYEFNKYLKNSIIISLVFLSRDFLFLSFIVIYYAILIVESLIFSYMYEKNLNFYKNYIENFLFSSDEKFAQQYMKFFWGQLEKNEGNVVVKQ